MPETARILQFPARQSVRTALSEREAAETAALFLSTAAESRSPELMSQSLSSVEVVFAICKTLYERRDSAPAEVARQAEDIYRWLLRSESIGLFDERDYLLGETAFLTGTALRQLGKRAESERWLDRADSSFRHTMNPAPNLAKVSYIRLALKYDMREFEHVLELVPSLLKSFDLLGMSSEFAKAAFLEAMAVKATGDWINSFEKFEALASDLNSDTDSLLLGQVRVEIGAFHAWKGNSEAALVQYGMALSLLKKGNHPVFLAHLKATVGETLIGQGRGEQGIDSYREAIADYESLGMSTQAAYLRVLAADALIQFDHPREAEWEILAALPVIEEQKMVPEGFAAISLLKESVARRNADRSALREVRVHLQQKQ